FSFFGKAKNYELQTTNSRRVLYLLPFLFTLILVPLSLIGPGFTLNTPEIDAGEKIRHLQLKEAITLPKYEYLFTQPRVIATYIRLLFFPINQNLDYDYPVYNSFFEPQVVLSFLFLLSIFGLGVYLFYRSRELVKVSKGQSIRVSEHKSFKNSDPMTLGRSDTSFIAFGILWFFITLSIESSIIPIRDVIFEHRLYLPSVGIFIAVLCFIADQQRYRWEKIGLTFVVAVAMVIVLLTGATHARNTIWRDEINLWEDVISKSPGKARPYNNLGVAYGKQGRFDEAIRQYKIAIKLKPDYAKAHNNLGVIYSSKGWIDDAIEHYWAAIRFRPDDAAEAYNNLATAYGDKGWDNMTVEYYQAAIKLKPDYLTAHYNLGITYEKIGLPVEAIREYQTVLRLNPDDVMAKSNLSRIFRIKK
ncbi:MAG: tetratricopeptide repeat protein, partial [Nitrospirae bacterium]|nr:tetratricopeptide repeat protein [Nitrospirota bacterium]